MSSSLTSNFKPDGTLIIVSGPSGAGKTTLVNRVCDFFRNLGSEIHFSISHTTRKPRANEHDGVEYHFISRKQFEMMVDAGEFIEWALVHGNMYGTARSEVEARLAGHSDVILDIDVQGARLISENKELADRAVMIFLFPPSFEELQRRLALRQMNSPEEIEFRLQKAESEIAQGLGFYDYVIINDDKEIATDCLKAAIIAKKLNTSASKKRLETMASLFKEEHRAGFTGER